jgi:CPA2 family monovalent cation:H+ antiporter-2
LAELGIIFLMFMVGLEFSLSAMIAARRDVFGAGSLQVGFTVSMVAGLAMLCGVNLPTAVLLGAAVAMSSTAIILKQLVDQGDVSTQQGRLVLGILSSRISRFFHFSLCSVDGKRAAGRHRSVREPPLF